MQHGATIMYHNITSKSTQSNSAYESALHNLVEHPDGVNKLLKPVVFFSVTSGQKLLPFLREQLDGKMPKKNYFFAELNWGLKLQQRNVVVIAECLFLRTSKKLC